MPNASRVPPDERSHRFHPTTVPAAVNVHVPADLLVADCVGEAAAAAFHDTRDNPGPANADCVVGLCVANSIQREPGCVTAAAPVIQSSRAFARYGSSEATAAWSLC